ncbi:MAG: hypothetical protein COA78_29765 [Blastopirellula sp.]|nr:MAG: hypothetical protein COA78_29765 [Blastopirellula sp.]
MPSEESKKLPPLIRRSDWISVTIYFTLLVVLFLAVYFCWPTHSLAVATDWQVLWLTLFGSTLIIALGGGLPSLIRFPFERKKLFQFAKRLESVPCASCGEKYDPTETIQTARAIYTDCGGYPSEEGTCDGWNVQCSTCEKWEKFSINCERTFSDHSDLVD